MSALDLLDDSFPHGTPAGFDRGCRSGGACLAKPVTGQSCKEAKTRYQRDAAYRALVQSGAAVEVLREPERPEQAPTVPAVPRPVPHAATPKLLQEKPAAPVRRHGGPIVHGTTNGYRRGCREDCPGGPDGMTCRQASAAAKQTRRTDPDAQPRVLGRKHGTTSGYQGGCRDDCPGDENGRTCRQATAEYRRDYARRAAGGRVAGAPVTPATKESAWPATDTTDEATSSTARTPLSPAASSTTSPADPTATPTGTTVTPGPTYPADQHPPTEPTATSPSAASAPATPTAGTSPTPGTPTTKDRRSPDPVTPFDDPSGVLQRVTYPGYRVAWLDGYHHGKATS